MTCVNAHIGEQKKRAVVLPQLEDVKNTLCVSNVAVT